MYSKWIIPLALLMYLAPAHAYWTGQDLTETEWAAWPDYCRAAYLSADWSNSSPFNGRLSASTRAEILKYNTIYGAHHFCIALVAMNRAQSKPANKAKELMKIAANEIDFCRTRMEKANAKYAFISAYYAKALFGAGDHVRAIDIWNESIALRPTEREAYLLKAQALISAKRPQEALETLQAFDSNKDQEWADAEYFLGYVYFELRRYDEAKQHLDKAKELGYPNNNLREKLLKMGK